MRESRRYLGLELAGAKNQKTALAVLEYYPKEQKTFLLDIFDKIAPGPNPEARDPHDSLQTGDEALLELIRDFLPESGTGPATSRSVLRMGVNVPMDLPPCITCTRRTCPLPAKCSVPAVKWMREISRKAARQLGKKAVREFTPYTQRPVELLMRYQVLPELPVSYRFEVDEALGGNKAPLTARMNFLLRHLGPIECVEAWPKLTVSILAFQLGLSRRLISTYRNIEEGIHSREEFLAHLVQEHGVFIYERDIHKLAQSLTAFDAFICAYTALLRDNRQTMPKPTGFPTHAGWVEYPKC